MEAASKWNWERAFWYTAGVIFGVFQGSGSQSVWVPIVAAIIVCPFVAWAGRNDG